MWADAARAAEQLVAGSPAAEPAPAADAAAPAAEGEPAADHPWIDDVPVTVPLADLGVVGLAGHRPRVLALARSLLGQVAARYATGDFTTGAADVLLGTFALPAEGDQAAVEIPFWMSAAQFEYWKHTHLTLDVVDGRGSGFSVEAPEGKRFLIRSRLMAGSG